MGVFNWGNCLLILSFTMLLYFCCTRKESIGTKLLFGFMLLTIFTYSGVGIAYESVSNRYIYSYVLFCLGLCLAVRFMFHTRFVLGKVNRNIDKTSYNGFDFDYNNRAITILAILFMITNGIHLIVPSFNLLKLFRPGLPTSELIYARRATSNSNIIIRLSGTINTFCLPFFCMYLKKLVDFKKKWIAILLVLFWTYLSYLQYDYLSRYEIVISIGLAFCIGAFVYPDGIKLVKKYVVIGVVTFIALVPFLYAYIDIRSGNTFEMLSIGKAIQSLIESEIFYPKYYDTCSSIYGSESIINFILWLVCLPIPSVLFPNKPTVTIAYNFTYAVSGLRYGAQAYYSSLLPSIVGEGIILWGPWLVLFHGLIIGLFIGAYFKFIKKYNSLYVLNVYMVLMILTMGRGGASSYMSKLINGTFAMLVWGYVFNKIRRSKDVQNMKEK